MSSVEPSYRVQPSDEKLSSAIVSDALDLAGLRNQTISRLLPVTDGRFIFGRARTVQYVPTTRDDPSGPYDDAIAFIDSLQPGHIAVSASGHNLVTAYWGELFSAAAKGRGAVGAITDGNIRDSVKIQALDFPVYSASRRPTDFRARMRVVAMHEPVIIEGVRIEDGDLIAADDDGIAVVPKAAEARVLDAARARAAVESEILVELLAGASLRSVWDRYKVL